MTASGIVATQRHLTYLQQNPVNNDDHRGRLWRLCRKELRETLRDRRTILTLVMMPLLLYPLLGMTLQRFLLSTKESQSRSLVIGLATEQEGMLLQRPADRSSQPTA